MSRFPLYELRDIQPGPPPAPGLSGPLLAGAGLLLTLLLGAWLLRQRARRRPLKQARQELLALSANQPDFMFRLTLWLKRTALLGWPREQIAPLHGHDWLSFLDQHGNTHFSRFAPRWSQWLYADTRPSPEEAAALLQNCHRWLHQLERSRPC